MQRIDFEDTTITRQPYVTIDNVDYEVQEGTYTGGTDLDADTFNTLQDNIEEALSNVGGNEIAISETEPTTETTKLWINSGEVGSQASEITNSYSTSTGIGYSANYVNNINTYSANEVRCGTWFGKPLYQRVIYISSLPNNSQQFFTVFSSSEISNIDVCFIDEGNSYMTVTDASNTETDTMNWIYSTSGYVMTCIHNKRIRIITKDDKSSTSAYVTVKYTKTTD